MEQLSLGLLKRARRLQNISTDAAAALVNRDRSFIWRVENGVTDLKVRTLTKLLNAYDISVADVFVKLPERQVSELAFV